MNKNSVLAFKSVFLLFLVYLRFLSLLFCKHCMWLSRGLNIIFFLLVIFTFVCKCHSTSSRDIIKNKLKSYVFSSSESDCLVIISLGLFFVCEDLGQM